MCRLLETIRLENGVLHNLKYHTLRFNRARAEFFGLSEETDLSQIISIPENCRTGVFRCRVCYSGATIHSIEFIPRQPRTTKSMKLVEDNKIDYHYKYDDRSQLTKLFEQRESCDEIIIIKNGLVTDCSVGNLVFFDGTRWLTPSSPLLNGTQRMHLLDELQITEKEIRQEDILNYTKVGIINAFYDLQNMPVIPISNIEF